MTLPLAEFLAVWVFLAVNIASPGPNVLNTIATAMESGRVAGFGSAAAVGFGIGLWCLGMTLGAAAVFAALPQVQTLLTLAATGLLGWFSVRYLRAARAARRGGPALPGGAGGLDFGGAFRRSLLVNLLNPKALTSWIAVLGVFPVARATPPDFALLCTGAVAVGLGLHLVYALVFSTPAAARLYLRAGWMLSAAAGVFFAIFALRLAAGLVAGPA